jgi:hypothetical protein
MVALPAQGRPLRAIAGAVRRAGPASRTSVTAEQTATTLRVEPDCVLSEEWAFRGMLAAAMARVRAEADWARRTNPPSNAEGSVPKRVRFIPNPLRLPFSRIRRSEVIAGEMAQAGGQRKAVSLLAEFGLSETKCSRMLISWLPVSASGDRDFRTPWSLQSNSPASRP